MAPEVPAHELFRLVVSCLRGRAKLGSGSGSGRRHGGRRAASAPRTAGSGARLEPSRARTRQPAGGAGHYPAALWRCSRHVSVPHALGFGPAAGRGWEANGASPAPGRLPCEESGGASRGGLGLSRGGVLAPGLGKEVQPKMSMLALTVQLRPRGDLWLRASWRFLQLHLQPEA